MATIGTLGSGIVFQVNDSKILTPTGISRTVTSNWSSHARIGKKPKPEFLGPALQSMALTIVLDAMHGVRPRLVLESIASMVESGRVEYFVIGGRPVGSNPWRITSQSETWGRVLNQGELLRATLNLTLEEYV